VLGPPWIETTPREVKVTGFFISDNIIIVPKVGPKLQAAFQLVGVVILGDLESWIIKDIARLHECGHAMSEDRLASILKIAHNCKDGAYVPSVQDHRKHTSPYESRFGSSWETEIAKSALLKTSVCITALIRHIVIESEKLFAGTYNGRDFLSPRAE
jgi:hypothetical protein